MDMAAPRMRTSEARVMRDAVEDIMVVCDAVLSGSR